MWKSNFMFCRVFIKSLLWLAVKAAWSSKWSYFFEYCFTFFLGWKVLVLIQDWSNMLRQRCRTGWIWIWTLCVALPSFDPLLIEDCFALNRKAWKQSNPWICEPLQEVQLSWLRREQAWWMRPPRLCSSTSATIHKTQCNKNNSEIRKTHTIHMFIYSKHVAWYSDPGFKRYFKQSLKS